MGTETRIGIATGLLIVVVASVYFFYGSDRSGEDLLIATGGPAAGPPRIPAVRGDRLASSDRQRSEPPAWKPVGPPSRSSARPARKTSPSSGTKPKWKHPAAAPRHNRPRVGQRFVGSAKPQTVTGPPTATPMRPRPVVKPPATHQPRPPMPLRTGPSKALVEATRNNVRPTSTPNRSIKRTGRTAASGRPATVATKPAVSWPTRHKISAGDTLSDISLRYYSTSAQVEHILRANPNIKNPKTLKIGDILIIPAPAPVVQVKTADKTRSNPARPLVGEQRVGDSGHSATPTGRRYRVRRGDTLYRIARKMLGNPSRWKEIYDRNRAVIGKDPLRLKPGMLLMLPR